MRSWMKLIVPTLVTLGGSFAHAEGPGHDYPPFLTIEGYHRTDFTERRFDEAVFVSDDTGTKTAVAGHRIKVEYRLNDETYGGDLYFFSSWKEQLRDIQKQIQGLQILYQVNNCRGGGQPVLTVRFQKGDTPVWVAVECWSDGYNVTAVEEQAFHH